MCFWRVRFPNPVKFFFGEFSSRVFVVEVVRFALVRGGFLRPEIFQKMCDNVRSRLLAA